MSSLSPIVPSGERALERRASGPARRPLIERLDSPKVVLGVLGGAAVLGLALAFGVLQGLHHIGTAAINASRQPVESRASTESSASRETKQSVATAQHDGRDTVDPSAGASAANGAEPRGSDTDQSRASDGGATPAPDVAPTTATEPVRLSVTRITPLRRGPRVATALLPPPRIDPAPRVAYNAMPAAMTPGAAQTRSAPALAAAPLAPTAPSTASPRGLEPERTADAERRVSAVLNAAARTGVADQERSVAAVAENVRAVPVLRNAGNPAAARRLNEDANRAFWVHQNVVEALQLERRAFEANPSDVEIAGNLAFYYLKQTPPHAEAAREVALHALSTSSPRFRTGRLEDWMSLGIASALTGRQEEAERAFLAGAALGNNLERTCRAALTAVATYGDAIRPAATALLRRVNAQGRSDESPYCAWPPNWNIAKPYPWASR